MRMKQMISVGALVLSSSAAIGGLGTAATGGRQALNADGSARRLGAQSTARFPRTPSSTSAAACAAWTTGSAESSHSASARPARPTQ